ncbi:MAG: hypothetical protein JW768_16095 [Chitinispirillaceae bacterium]|nr:hypothetical protein [Chitinispirillaceae bacterium]
MAGKSICEKIGLIGIGFALFSICMVMDVAGEIVGKFQYTPINQLNGDTLFVSDTIIAMDKRVIIDDINIVDSIVDTPAICFLIDHSTSMSTAAGMNDPQGYRFTVPYSLLDTIFLKYPTAEVGYVVFKDGLYFLYDDHPDIFGQYSGSAQNDGFMPLKVLNRMYGTQYGLDLLKTFLEGKLDTNNNREYIELRNEPSTWPREGTNITLAFNAAKQVLAGSQRENACKYIIFLSDGEETAGGTTYINGEDCPTTFTIYFTSSGTAPTSLVTMTNNIKANGFSATNFKSSIWPFQVTDFDALMSFVRDSVYYAIRQQVRALPDTIIISSQTASNWANTDSSFTFTGLFPLTGTVTSFSGTVNYQDSASSFDSIISFNFFVSRTANSSAGPGKQISFWDRNLSILHNGAPITVMSQAMDSIELRFTFDSGDARYSYANVQVEVTTVFSGEREVVQLSQNDMVFSAMMKRTSSGSATADNGILETFPEEDTVFAIFRNSETPALPLDTLKRAVLYTPHVAIDKDNTVKRASVIRPFLLSDNGTLRVVPPGHGSYSLTVYSLSGKIIASLAVSRDPVALKVPKGICIVSMEEEKGKWRMWKKIAGY